MMFSIYIVNINNHNLSANSWFASKGKEDVFLVKAVSLISGQQGHKPDGREEAVTFRWCM